MTETIPEYGGCLWPLDPACLTDEWEVAEVPVRERSHALATETMRRLTAYRVGGCPITIRPNVSTGMCFVPTTGGYGFGPGMDMAGNWVNNCGRQQGIPGSIRLPTPIGPVAEVKVDGAVIAEARYAVYDNYLVPMDDTLVFPSTQDVRAPDSEPGTMSITYLNAYPVDSVGAHAGGLLTMEFVKLCGGKKCRLPKGTRAVVRQGVSFEIEPGMFPDGFTGIPEVDAYIERWNPTGRLQQTRVWSPDLATYRVQR